MRKRERRLEPLERDALPAQQVADALERGDGQQPGQNRRIEHVEFARHDAAFSLQARLLPDDGRFELQLAAFDPAGLVQRLQKIAGVGGGQAELLPFAVRRQGQRKLATVGQPATEVGRAPAIRVADQIGVHRGKDGGADDHALCLQVHPHRRLESGRGGFLVPLGRVLIRAMA